MVLNVRDLEVSHKFWTEIIGFRCVAALKPIPGRQRPKMRFYSGVDAKGDLTHHDLALAEVPQSNGGAPEPWSLMPGRSPGLRRPRPYCGSPKSQISSPANRSPSTWLGAPR